MLRDAEYFQNYVSIESKDLNISPGLHSRSRLWYFLGYWEKSSTVLHLSIKYHIFLRISIYYINLINLIEPLHQKTFLKQVLFILLKTFANASLKGKRLNKFPKMNKSICHFESLVESYRAIAPRRAVYLLCMH